MRNNAIECSGIVLILKVLQQKNRNLKRVELNCNPGLKNNIASDIIGVITDNKFIETINLFNFTVPQPYIHAFVQAIMLNKFIKIGLLSNDKELNYIMAITDRESIPKSVSSSALSVLQWANEKIQEEVVARTRVNDYSRSYSSNDDIEKCRRLREIGQNAAFCVI